MTASIKVVIRNKALSGLPRRVAVTRGRADQPYFQYMLLSWAGMCVCELLAPRDSFHLKFYGVFCFLFLGMAALSVYISGKFPRLPKGMPPDPDSMLHLDD